MPMQIQKIIEDFSSAQGKRVLYYNGSFLDNNLSESEYKSYQIAERSIKAITFDDLQIYGYAYSGVAKLYVKGQKFIDIPSGSGNTYVCFFTFDSTNTIPTLSSSITYDTATAAGLSNFTSMLASIVTGTTYAGKHFAIISSGIQTFDSTIVSKLQSIGDFSAQAVSGGMINYVAIGYNNKITDSMFNGPTSSGGESQLYINGTNAALSASIKSNIIYGTPSTPTYLSNAINGVNNQESYLFTIPSDNYEVTVDLGAVYNIDYIIFLHKRVSDKPYTIFGHSIYVYDSSSTRTCIKQPSSDEVETDLGQRYYLFSALDTSTTKITAGLESSIAMAGMFSSYKRNVAQSAYTGFYDTIYSSSFHNSIDNLYTGFNYGTVTAQGTDKDSKVEKIDVEQDIYKAERVKYNVATCKGSSCSYACLDNCSTSCISNCGNLCGGSTCANECLGTCNATCFAGCTHNCATNCTYYCGAQCSGSCGVQCDSACGNLCRTTCGSACSDTCAGNCSGACGALCDTGCGSSCYGSCGGNCSQDCGAVCHSTCGSACTGYCGSTCTAACGNGCSTAGCSNSCTSVCDGSCDGSCKGGWYVGMCWQCNNDCCSGCANRCADNCQDKCHTGCSSVCYTGCTESCSSACYHGCDSECTGYCYGSCKDKCGGTCAVYCYSTCTGHCYGTCTVSCGDGCSTSCYSSCNTGCYATCKDNCNIKCNSICGHLCEGGCSSACQGICSVSCHGYCSTYCNLTCSSSCLVSCTIMCVNACKGSCSNSCTATCVNSASSDKPAYI